MADSVQDDPETHSYNVHRIVEAFVQKAEEWQDCVQGERDRQMTLVRHRCSNNAARVLYTLPLHCFELHIAKHTACAACWTAGSELLPAAAVLSEQMFQAACTRQTGVHAAAGFVSFLSSASTWGCCRR